LSLQKTALESATDTVIYRFGVNAEINRNCEAVTPTDSAAVISQHIPNKHMVH